MADQKICDECGAIGTKEEITSRALLVSRNDKGTVHIHVDASTDRELCDKCMKAQLRTLMAHLDAPAITPEKGAADTLYASRVQPR